ncbi:cleft lip and palate transmembrane protein 1-domain-containing protein [Thamnocephalis sphaerospora]|uniref:Cleft lip and palate transmembrane protein 1-domain-containing protein n=1 Tax=Thamnocephalis sphaerospora TaxID=78915 RepID=A0A4P9XQR6_9FUNG|nr:cleft lip and palate transmembrane protein 1-domain-containing protein [Thamnocephalis sphaerospora]|eukprot:RKP08397.1 cleft lip and palate transmembrane protein 1-domain-containing protein [Thamnocephalis sphaerospora]
MSAPAAADANQAVAPGGIRISAAEANKFRLMLVDIKPWLLLATLLAAVLHLLFEWLAFKEDVAHWRKLENTAGVSRMSVILEAVSRCMAVVFLWERRRDTSILFIGSACLSAAVELWKVRRVLRASKAIKPAQRNATVDKSKSDNADVPMLTETEQLSRDVDRQSTRTIGLACVPLAIGYAAWSLVFQKHAGFRAWAIDALMAGMYLLGFITLTPQLFLNHRLKSVAAMPLRVFMYRALNTFVDDLFAMVFPMPTLTRLATFRDDIVFVVLLWQWWRYPSRKAEDVEKLKQE